MSKLHINSRKNSLESHWELLRQHNSRFVIADHILACDAWIVTVWIARAPDAVLSRLKKATRITNQ
jgi:hypothetical protein